MSFNYQAPALTPVKFLPAGGSLAILDVRSQQFDTLAVLATVSNTGLGRAVGRFATQDDSSGSASLFLDLDNVPWNAIPNIKSAVYGVFLHHVSPTRYFQFPAVIERVHFEGVVEGGRVYEWQVEWKQAVNQPNGLAFVVYPSLT